MFLPSGLQPAAHVPAGETKPAEPDAAPDRPAEEEKETETGDRKKLLIVEDNEDFRTFLAQELGRDYEVVEAADGVEGEERVYAEWPDLVIST